MRTHIHAHNTANTKRWNKEAQVYPSSSTAANEAVFSLRHVEHPQHPGIKRVAKVGGGYLALIAVLATIAFVAA